MLSKINLSALKPALSRVWGWIVSGLERARVSFVALVSSRQVWVATTIVGLVAWSAGYAMGGRAGRSSMPALGLIQAAPTVSALALDEAAARASRAAVEARKWKLDAEAYQAEVRAVQAELSMKADAVKSLQASLSAARAALAAAKRADAKPATPKPAPEPAKSALWRAFE
jgi:hypothetical protein